MKKEKIKKILGLTLKTIGILVLLCAILLFVSNQIVVSNAEGWGHHPKMGLWSILIYFPLYNFPVSKKSSTLAAK